MLPVKKVLIYGGSGGIGSAKASLLKKKQMDLHLVGRNDIDPPNAHEIEYLLQIIADKIQRAFQWNAAGSDDNIDRLVDRQKHVLF